MAEEPKDVSAPKEKPEVQAPEVPEPAQKASELDVSKANEVPAPKEAPEAQSAESSQLKRKTSKSPERDQSKSRQSKKKSSSAEKSDKDETKASRKSHSPSHRHDKEDTKASKKSGRHSSRTSPEKAAKEETKASEKQEKEGAAGPTKEAAAAAAAAGGGLSARNENISPISPSQPFKAHTSSETSPLPPTANAGSARVDRGDLLKERLVLAGVIFCFVCIVAIMLIMESFSKKEKVQRNLPCVGQECQEVVDLTESLMDHSVSPCADFYRHVCGHWIKNTARPSSFMADVARNFSLVLHEAISQNQGEAQNNALRRSASVFYNSCLAFTSKSANVKATTDELFKALGLSVTDWLKMTDPTLLFAQIVHLSLVNRFHALVSVSIFSSGAHKTLQVYRIPAMHTLVREIYHESLAAYLGQVVKAIGKDDATEAVVKEVVNLDKNRGKKPSEESDAQLNLTEVKCKNFPGKTWREAVEKDISLPQNIMVTATVAGSICDDLNSVLVDTTTAARPLYLLAEVAAHVLTYDYELSENREASAARAVCYRATALVFEDVWLHFLSGFLFINAWIEEVVNAYMNYITNGIKNHVSNWTWMAAKDKAATVEKLQKIRFTRFYGQEMSKQAVECSSGKQVADTSFVSNMVRLNYRNVKNCMSLSVNRSEALVRQKLLGNELAANRSSLTVVLPSIFVVPPMYYRKVEDDKFINIAVLGTQFARKVVSLADRRSSYQAPAKNATSSWSKGTLANYSAFQDCYHSKSAQLHEKLNGDQFDDAFSVMVAMHIAFEGKRDYERDYVKKSVDRMHASNAVLYKRACLSLCTGRGAPKDANALDYTTAYAACLFGAANAPSFALTFGCKPEETMSAIGRCYSG